MAERKIIDETHVIAAKKGNGLLRREVWVDANNVVSRYNLAYINHQLFKGDNGRVFGFDNAHGYHHRHYFGKVEAIDFTSFENVEHFFELEWIKLRG
ncbi:MAG: hypothetical protein ABL885_05750 [Methylophilaceae bacterium]